MSVPERHRLKECVDTESDHHGNGGGVVVMVRVAVLDAAGKIIEHYLQEKTE